MNLRLHIDRVIIEGRTMTFAERETFRAELAAELRRELLPNLQRSFGAVTGTTDSLSIPSSRSVVLDASPQALAGQIATALHGGLVADAVEGRDA